jgi:hypothetical protein
VSRTKDGASSPGSNEPTVRNIVLNNVDEPLVNVNVRSAISGVTTLVTGNSPIYPKNRQTVGTEMCTSPDYITLDPTVTRAVNPNVMQVLKSHETVSFG